MKRNYLKPGMVIVQLAPNAGIMEVVTSVNGDAFKGSIRSGAYAGRTKEQNVWDEEW